MEGEGLKEGVEEGVKERGGWGEGIEGVGTMGGTGGGGEQMALGGWSVWEEDEGI